MTRFFLIRHGQTEWNREKRIQGQLDVELSPKGREQAHLVGQALEGEGISRIYTSDLSRARETGEIIAGHLGVPLSGSCPRLREIDFGRWSGLTFAEIEGQDPDTLAWWRDDSVNRPVPAGESFRQVAERVISCITALGRKHTGEKVAVITHGGPVTYLLGTLLNLDLKQRLRLGIANCSISVIDYNPEEDCWEVINVNERGHLGQDEDSRPQGFSY